MYGLEATFNLETIPLYYIDLYASNSPAFPESLCDDTVMLVQLPLHLMRKLEVSSW